MTEYRDVLERKLEQLSPPRIPIDRLARRRDRKRRNQRISAALVGIAVSLLAIGSFVRVLEDADRTGRPSPSPAVERTVEPGVLSLVDLSTGRARPLPDRIANLRRVGGFEISPDGESLAFDAEAQSGHPRLVSADSGGTLSEGSALVGSDGIHQIFVSDVDGSNLRQVTHDVRVHARNPSWSPDGTMLVYEGRTYPEGLEDVYDDLFVLNVETGAERRVWLDLGLDAIPEFDMHTPSFGPNGATIIYSDFDPLRGSVDLRSVSVQGGESTLLVADAAFGSVSPDRRMIAYRKASLGPAIGTAVSLATIDGATQLPSPSVPERDPVMGSLLEVDAGTAASWSPSGRQVAYTEGASNLPPNHVYVFDLDTRRVTRLGRGTEVAWLDDDTLIVRFYQDR